MDPAKENGKKPEFLTVYALDGEPYLRQGIPLIQDRKQFYRDSKAEYREHTSISKKVKAILMLLMKSNGKIIHPRRTYLRHSIHSSTHTKLQ